VCLTEENTFRSTPLYRNLNTLRSGKSKLECLRISVITEPCQLIMEAYMG